MNPLIPTEDAVRQPGETFGLGDLTALTSPDTGTTTYTVNAAGERTGQTDARGKATGYSYDALGRLTAQTVPTSTQNLAFAYDTPPSDCLAGETFGTGRLDRITDESGSTRYCYDRRGQAVRTVHQVTGGTARTVGATFDAAGHLTAMTYPSGAIVTFLRNGNGQIARVDAQPSAGASQVTLVSNATYLPFGPLTTLTYGNGRILSKTYDQNYGIDAVQDNAASNPLSQDFTLNAVGNVTGLTERTTATTTLSRSFTYDGLDRLTAQKNGATTVEGFSYDATGNRLNKTGANAGTYTYPSSSHRLSSVASTSRSYDANGNTTAIGTASKGKAFSYDDRNRLREVKVANKLKASYRYNGRGERVLKTAAVTAANSRQFVYDDAGHLLGEYTLAGARVKEYVWLDDTLIAILSDHDASTYQFVETDHLGTPRAVVHPSSNQIVWRWDLNNTAFGEHAPSENPDGNALSYQLNLRFPGQYFDAESGLFYNYFRDYDPGTGRYIESDPIGLQGGNATYLYGSGNSLRRIDSMGLWSTAAHNHLIEEFARRNGIGGQLMKAMKGGSAHADSFLSPSGYPGYQGAMYSYMHAMTSSAWPDKAQACQMAGIYTDRKYSEFSSGMSSGNGRSKGAWFSLGMGLHTIMDNTSPAHTGFQYWQDSDAPRHGPRMDMDLVFGDQGLRSHSLESIEDLLNHPEILEKTLNDMQRYYKSGSGVECSCQ